MQRFPARSAPALRQVTARRHAIRRVLRATSVATAATIAALAVAAPGAQATTGELPVNALAPEITTAAEAAVTAFDDLQQSDELSAFLTYADRRTATAHLVARQLGYVEEEMAEAWQAAGLAHQRAVLSALTQVGVPYRRNAKAVGEGFDCSGLTQYAWEEAGVEIDRVSSDQIRGAEQVGRDGAQAGDLVHYPGHIMMYLGVDNAVIHSITTGRTVEIDTISERRASSVRFGDPLGD